MIIGVASADYARADRTPDGKEKWGGAGWARLGQYLPHYRAAGHTVVTGTLWQDDDRLTIEQADHTRVAPDLILCQRLMHEGLHNAFKVGRAAGQVIINDLDDWYWGLDPSNAAFKASHPNTKITKRTAFGTVQQRNFENTNGYSTNIANSDLLTVSTPYLAERMARRVKCPIVIIPNYIDVERFSRWEQTPGDVPLVGWAGSTAHRSGDVETVGGVLRPMAQRGEIRLHHSGDWFDSPKFADMIRADPELVSTLPRTDSEHYPDLLKFDVGIVPLRDTPFNHAKSEIKGLEYAAAGIPFVAQDMSSYHSLYNEWGGQGFFLASRPKDWITGLKGYRDYQKRLDHQDMLLDLVQNRNIHFGVQQWLDVLEGMKS